MAGIEQISTSDIPTLDVLQVFFDKTPADETSASGGDTKLKLNNFIKAKITVGLSYNDIYKDTTVNKYLKFKVILCSTPAELEYYKDNITKIDKYSDKNVKTFSFADLRLLYSTQKQTNFFYELDYILRVNNSEKIIRDQNYNILIYSHYDVEKLERDFNFSIKDTLNFETLFYSVPKAINVKNLYNDGKVIKKDIYSIITNFLNDDNLFNKAQSKIKPVKKFKSYISPLICTKDINNGQNILRYGFFFDKDRFILENTLFPELYATSLWTDVLAKSKNINVELTRYKLADIEKNGNHFNEVIAAPIISDKAKDVFSDLDFYTGTDNRIYSKRSGLYGYKVKLEFVDGAFAVILDQIKNLKSNIKALKEYKTIVSQPTISTGYLKNLNPYLDKGMEEVDTTKFKQGKYSYEEDRILPSAGPDYTNLLSGFDDVFSIAYSCLYELNDSIAPFLRSMVYPSVASLNTVDSVIEFHYRLLIEFKNILHRKLDYVDESKLLSEQNSEIGQVPVSLQIVSASREFDTQIDTEEYTNFGLRYHIATAYNDIGIASVSDVNELQANNIYGNKKYIGPKFIYIKDRYALPLALTGIPQYYFDTIHSFLETYNTKTFDTLLNKYNYIDAPIDVTSVQAAQTPLSSRILLNKNKISFDGIQGLPNLDESSKNISLDRGLHTLANLIEEWSNTIIVNNQKYAEIDKEYQSYGLRKIYVTELFKGATNQNIDNASAFKVVYDGIKQVSELVFGSVSPGEDDKKQYIVADQVKILNDFKFIPHEGAYNSTSTLFSNNNNIKYIKESNVSYPNAKYTKLCYLQDYSNPGAYLMNARFQKVPIFNRWFFLNDDTAVTGPTELLGAKPDIFSSTPPQQTIIPTNPTISVTPVPTNTGITPVLSSPIPQRLPTPITNGIINLQQNPLVVGAVGLNQAAMPNASSEINPSTVTDPVNTDGAVSTVKFSSLASNLTVKPNTLKIN
jgi:hypothetical protein